MRYALSQALAAQEMRHFQPMDEDGNPHWQGDNITIIKASAQENFDNEMTLCIDGREITRITSDMSCLASRQNVVWSEMRARDLKEYKGKLLKTLKLAGVSPGSDEYNAVMGSALNAPAP